MERADKYVYRFPVDKQGSPKYSPEQLPGEIINFKWDDKEAIYLTNKKHPELVKRKDVKFEEYEPPKPTKKPRGRGKK